MLLKWLSGKQDVDFTELIEAAAGTATRGSALASALGALPRGSLRVSDSLLVPHPTFSYGLSHRGAYDEWRLGAPTLKNVSSGVQ